MSYIHVILSIPINCKTLSTALSQHVDYQFWLVPVMCQIFITDLEKDNEPDTECSQFQIPHLQDQLTLKCDMTYVSVPVIEIFYLHT